MSSRQKILIVDDTPENIQVLMESLKDDYAIVAATNGEKALAMAAKEPRPDIILLDVMMPGMDGYEVCSRLKADEATSGIPVIFITALTEAGEEARGLSLGAVDYITKPFNASLVKARVHNQLELKLHRDQLEDLVEERTRELLATTAEKQKLESELELARQLQMTLLPDGYVLTRRHEISAQVEPARLVGGDFFDHFPLADGRLCVLVGDVSGKGAPAALFMVRASTVLRSVALLHSTPDAILAQANRELCQGNEACMFVTVACMILDRETGEAVFGSAGHEFPLLVSPGRSTEFVLVPSGTALGLEPSSTYVTRQARLKDGDGVLLYTDGITEAFNETNKAFGEMQLLDVVSRNSALDPPALMAAILEDVRKHVGEAPQSDDITLLAMRYAPPRGGG